MADGNQSFRQYVPALVVIVVLLGLAALFHEKLSNPSVVRGCVVSVLAAAVLYDANKRFFAKDDVRFVIVFDSVAFITIGVAATVLACVNWEIALLLAGSCLLIGGFFGLLFGYPQGVAQQSKPAQDGQVSPPPPGRDKTLLADSAATLGKVITGFTLAKLGSAATQYWTLCKTIGPVLLPQSDQASYVLAAVVMAYFLATGFLSGLLLPTYFMSDVF